MKNGRLNFIFGIFFLFIAVIIYRLIFIQIIHGDFYKALAQGLHKPSYEIQQDRGEIFFSKGEPLAINTDFTLVFASPPKIKEPEKTAEILSQILKLDKDSILQEIKVDTLYQPIKDKLTSEEIEAIKKENLSGIYLNKERGRFYPHDNLASQTIGFVDTDQQGQYGLEEYHQETLEKGGDLVLTIDYTLQFKAERLLEKAKENYGIQSGQIIIIDPRSGKILALANFPGFNPNKYEEYAANDDLGIFKNKSTQEIFEPGSVFKAITMAAALNEEKITPQTTYVDEGYVKIGQRKIENYAKRVWGEKTMTEVLENSINTGAVFAEEQIPHQFFLDYMEKFGIFKSSGVDLPEVYSENKEFKKGYEINFATASFGQGIEMTPLQLIRAYSAIANGGYLIKPYLVEGIFKNGEISEQKIEQKIENESPIISSKTASQLTAMLISVVENGYGKGAKIPGYYIAGKTGTAQIPYSVLGINKSGYSEEDTIQTFIGYFPAFEPRFLALVKLDRPNTKTAEYSALPIFHELTEFLIHYYQIPYDYKPS